MNSLDLEEINGTPIFVSPNEHNVFSRIYGAIFDRDRLRWFFPAYPPFGLTVVSDLRKIAPNLVYSEAAKKHITNLADVPRRVQARILPDGFTYVTKPFDHQIEGLAYLYYNPRFALLWDAGTAKTKVLIDLKRLLPKQRMLVFGPKVIVSNWLREIELHGPELRAVAIRGTPAQKIKILRDYKKYDVLIASYGTARTFGLPRLHRSTLKDIRDAEKSGVHLSKSGLQRLARALRSLCDAERQAAYVAEWAKGMTIAELERQVDAEAKTQVQWIEDIDYSIIVADESHCIKESSSQQTKAVLGLSRKAARRYLMSGTPTLGDPRHLYPQMKFLSPAIIPEDWLQFANMFLVRAPNNQRVITGFKNLNVLNARVQRVAIRKRKDECLDLPPRTMIDIPFTLSSEQQKLYNTLVSLLQADLGSFFSDPTTDSIEIQNAAVLLNKLSQVISGFVIDNQKKSNLCNECPHLASCVAVQAQPYTQACKVITQAPPSQINYFKDNPKLELLNELLDSILEEPKNKVIIWGVYRAELDLIMEALKKRGVGYVRVDGSTGGNVQDRIDLFNKDPDCRVYLSQEATGVGITLNAATYMIYYSYDWSLGTWMQSLDRNYRAGQTEKTTVYRLYGEGTIDGYKIRVLDEKKDISAILANKLACATCLKHFDCLKAKIDLFDPGCVYQRSVKRTVAHAKVIQ